MSDQDVGKWVASLSNGETIHQEPDVEGEPSCWRKLLARCEEENIHITQIQLQAAGMTLIALQNADGYCAVYEKHLSIARGGGKSANSPAQQLYQGVGAVFGDFVFLTFTNKERTLWTDVRPLASMSVHCQLKPAGARRRADDRPRSQAAVRAEVIAEARDDFLQNNSLSVIGLT